MRNKIRRAINGDVDNGISPICTLWNYTGWLATELSCGIPGQDDGWEEETQPAGNR